MQWTRKSAFVIECGDYKIYKQDILGKAIYSSFNGDDYIDNFDTAEEAKQSCQRHMDRNERVTR